MNHTLFALFNHAKACKVQKTCKLAKEKYVEGKEDYSFSLKKGDTRWVTNSQHMHNCASNWIKTFQFRPVINDTTPQPEVL